MSTSGGLASAAATDGHSPGRQERKRPSQGDVVQAVAFSGPIGGLVDIGVNLVDRSYEKDRSEVISRAQAVGVSAMVVTGTCVRTSTAACRLAEGSADYPLYFTAGVHPHNAKTCNKDTLARLTELASSAKCVAIGECGLDFNRNFSRPEVQIQWFDEQIKLAKQLGKPLFLHCRDAADDFAALLASHAPLGVPAVVHCFTGSGAELTRFLEMGMYIGITGWVCDDRPERGGAELAALLQSIPPERLMIETDAPYLTPRTIKPSRARPGRNEPALLPHVLRAVAAAVGKPEADVARETRDVARAVFGISLPQAS